MFGASYSISISTSDIKDNQLSLFVMLPTSAQKMGVLDDPVVTKH
jgi:hypothetical protein